eukprot:1450883-Pyramimonas_sp.AAC.1
MSDSAASSLTPRSWSCVPMSAGLHLRATCPRTPSSVAKVSIQMCPPADRPVHRWHLCTDGARMNDEPLRDAVALVDVA